MSNSYKRTNWIKSSCSTSQKMRSIVSVKDTDIISTFILDHIKYKHRKILAFMLKWEKNNIYIYIYLVSQVSGDALHTENFFSVIYKIFVLPLYTSTSVSPNPWMGTYNMFRRKFRALIYATYSRQEWLYYYKTYFVLLQS